MKFVQGQTGLTNDCAKSSPCQETCDQEPQAEKMDHHAGE